MYMVSDNWPVKTNGRSQNALANLCATAMLADMIQTFEEFAAIIEHDGKRGIKRW